MTAQTRNFTVDQGLNWKRIIYMRERLTRRVMKPSAAQAGIQTNALGGYQALTVEVLGDGGISLELDAVETRDLPLGALSYDVLATVNGVTEKVAQGTLTVVPYTTVTYGDEDVTAMQLRTRQYADFRRDITFKDAVGTVLPFSEAYLVAKDAADVTVLDLRWFGTAPAENTIAALPAAQRGYLAPKVNCSCEMHISETNPIAAGNYAWYLYAKMPSTDWEPVLTGSLVVEKGVAKPV